MIKKSMLCALTLLLVLLCLGTGAYAQETIKKTATNFQELSDAFADAPEGATVTITLLNPFNMTGKIDVPAGRDYTLYGADFTLGRGEGSLEPFFFIDSGATLSIYRIALDGGGVPANVLVEVLGTFNASHASFQNNKRKSYDGGAIKAGSNAKLSFSYADFAGNEARNGGAIYSVGAEITIRDGSLLSGNSAVESGGAIYLQSGKLNFYSSKMENNSAGTAGGGAYLLYGATAQMNGATLEANSAPNGGGMALDSGGNAAAEAGGKLYLEDASRISNNKATAFGGGVYASGAAYVYLGGTSELRGNESEAGGGLWINGKNAVLRMAASAKISGNRSGGEGGGAWLSGVQATLSGNALVDGNNAAHGGGAYLTGGSLTLRGDAAFRSNIVSSGGRGGGVYLNGTAMAMEERSIVSGNRAMYGGGCFCRGSSARLTMSGSAKISENGGNQQGITSGGGAELQDGASLNMTDYAAICNNRHQIGTGGGVYLQDNCTASLSGSASIYGNVSGTGAGVLLDWGKSLTLTDNASIHDNHATITAGGVSTVGSPRITLSGAPRITGNTSGDKKIADNCYRSFNNTEPLFKIAGNLSRSASIGVTLNTDIDGYRIAQSADGTTTYESSADRFTCDTDSDYLGLWDSVGKAGVYFNSLKRPVLVYVNGVNPSGPAYWWSNIKNAFNSFVYDESGNTRPKGTNAFTLRFLEKQTGVTPWEIRSGITLTLTGSDILSTLPQGKNLFTVKSGGKLILDGITIDGQLSGDSNCALVKVEAGGTLEFRSGAQLINSGGYGVANAGTLLIEHGYISSCQNSGVNNLSSGAMTMKGLSLISGNRAYNGGGIYNQGKLFLQGGWIDNNRASGSGGGLYNTLNGSLNMTGGGILNNIAQENGGGAYSAGGVTVNGTGAVISANTAEKGGGLYAGGTLDITVGFVHTNTAEEGGGLFFDGTTLTFGKKAESFSNGATSGGGLYLKAGTANLEGTVYGNDAQNGGGLYVKGGTLGMTGGVCNNAAAGDGGGLYADGGTLNLEGRVYGNSAANEGGGLFAAAGAVQFRGYAALTGNYAGSGAGIQLDGGSLTLGARTSVTENRCSADAGIGGVNFKDGTIAITDTATVRDNLNASGADSNLYLPAGKTIQLGEVGPLGKVYLSPEALPTADGAEIAVASYPGDNGILPSNFALDDAGTGNYYFYKNTGSVLLKKAGDPVPGVDIVAVDMGEVRSYHTNFAAAMTYIKNNITDGRATITLLADVKVGQHDEIPAGATIDIVGNAHSLIREEGYKGPLLTVTRAQQLNLRNITLDGAAESGAQPLMRIGSAPGEQTPAVLTASSLTLKNNTGGAAVENNGLSYLSGDVLISGNNAGVTGTGTLNLSGNVRIAGNAASNLLFPDTTLPLANQANQTIKLSGALTGTLNVAPQTPGKTRYPVADGENGYTPQPSDAEHFLWDGETDGLRFMYSNGQIIRAKCEATVDGVCFTTFFEALNYVNSASRYANGQEASVVLQEKELYVSYNSYPVLAAGRTAVLSCDIDKSSLNRGIGYPKSEPIIKVYGALTLAGKLLLNNDLSDDDAAPAAEVFAGGLFRLTDSAGVSDNTKNAHTGDSVKNEGTVELRDNSGVGTLRGGGALSLSDNVKLQNVYLPAGSVISIADALGNAAEVKVTPDPSPTAGNSVAIARGVADADQAARINPTDGALVKLFDGQAQELSFGIASDRSLDVSPASHSFSDLVYGEAPAENLELTLSNRSFHKITVSLSPAADSVFVLSGLPLELEAGASAKISATVKANLPLGTYGETLRFTDGAGQFAPAELSVKVKLPFDIADMDALAIATQPNKLSYRAGEALDLAGLTVSLHGNGRTATGPVADFAVLSPGVSPAEGTVLDMTNDGKPVVVTLGGFGASTRNLAVREDDYTPVTAIDMIAAREMTVGQSAYPAAELNPKGARLNDLLWTSSDESVASVSDKGLVRALKPGTATITGTSRKHPELSASCAVTVVAKDAARESAQPRSFTLAKGKKINLAKRYGAFYAWTSEDESIASVSGKGMLKGVNPGVTTLRGVLGGAAGEARAKSALVGDQIILRVTVVKKGRTAAETPSLIISPDLRTQAVGEVSALSVQTVPADADLRSLIWESANKSVARVDAEGFVTGVSVGETTITARLGALTATARVIVKEETADETLTLSVDFLAIAKGKKIKLNELTGFKGSWSVENKKIASVSPAGILKAKKTGQTVLTFTVAKALKKNAAFMGKSLLSGDSVRIALSVTAKGDAVTKLKLRGDSAMAPGDTQLLKAVLTPKAVSYPQLFYRSSDPETLSVDGEGKLRAKKLGAATITATATSGVSASIKITVSDRVTEIILNPAKKTIKAGEKLRLLAEHFPASLSAPLLNWKSGKESVATVDENGWVTAHKAGKATITATGPDGLEASCKIRVK